MYAWGLFFTLSLILLEEYAGGMPSPNYQLVFAGTCFSSPVYSSNLTSLHSQLSILDLSGLLGLEDAGREALLLSKGKESLSVP